MNFPDHAIKLTTLLGSEWIFATRVSDGKSIAFTPDTLKTFIGAGGGQMTGAQIRQALGVTTLSGSNTGDQDLTAINDEIIALNNMFGDLSGIVANATATTGYPGSQKDLTVGVGKRITDSSYELKPAANSATFTWQYSYSIPSGQSATIAQANTLHPLITLSSPGEYVFEFTVIDNIGGQHTSELHLFGVASSITTSEKGAANGVAPLGSDSKIAATYLPSYVDDVLEYATLSAFPATGETGKIYVAINTNLTYRWSGSAYIQLVASPGTSDAVTEGTTNLYYTTARAALKAPLASPVFTGAPSMPTGTIGVTQAAGDNSTKLATTAFVAAMAALKSDLLLTIAEKTASGTMLLTDNGKLVTMNVAAANTYTVPAFATVAIPVGAQVPIAQTGTGQTTIVAASGVTILSSGNKLKLAQQGSMATLIKVATNQWLLAGDLVA